jgi:hypothetical protein
MDMGAYFTVSNQSLLFRRQAAVLERRTKDRGQLAQTLLAQKPHYDGMNIKAISLAPGGYRIGN